MFGGIDGELMCRMRGEVPHIVDTETSLRLIADQRLSVSRFGDGEFDLALGSTICFQDADAQLANRLRDILREGDSASNHRLAIPLVMSTLHGYTNKSKIWWLKYFARRRKQIQPLLKKGQEYLDAQISRVYINRKNKDEAARYFALWKRIWLSRKVLIVEGAETKLGAGNDLLRDAESVHRIICPAENAFGQYEVIYKKICDHVGLFDVVLIALGPTATVLAKDLSNAGIWAIDSGHLDLEYEWSLRRVSRKTAIPGKTSPETGCSSARFECEKSKAYISQIIGMVT